MKNNHFYCLIFINLHYLQFTDNFLPLFQNTLPGSLMNRLSFAKLFVFAKIFPNYSCTLMSTISLTRCEHCQQLYTEMQIFSFAI